MAVKGLTNHFNRLSVDFPRKINKTKMSAMWLSEIYWRRVRRVMKRAELSLEIMKCCTENKEIWLSYSISLLTARSRKFPIPSDISRIFSHYYSLYNKNRLFGHQQRYRLYKHLALPFLYMESIERCRFLS